MDVDQLKQRNAWIWDQGDYGPLSRRLAPAAAALAEACEVASGQEVLDVAAGDGNFALEAVRRGARVVASDLAPGMVERGKARSATEGVEIEWTVADVEDLPFEDGRFDCVGSVFGAVIAPRQQVVARELFRVTRPGGTIGLTAWCPGSFTAELIAIGRRYAPPAAGVPRSDEWGVEETARERLGPHAASVRCERRVLIEEGESPEAMVAELESVPTVSAAREILPPDRYQALVADIRELSRRFAAHADSRARIVSDYLVVVARKPE
jgi:SAM-dependent methyltransferase